MRSKAHWGYDDAFMAACLDDLKITAQDVLTHPCFLVERDGCPLGFYHLTPRGQDLQLQHLFVAPEAIGLGLGRRLWQHLLAFAQANGSGAVYIDSDPHAETFYLAMGAQRIGSVPSSAVLGRVLPLMCIRLRPTFDL